MKNKIFTPFLLSFCLTGWSAQAQECPVAGDLNKGILITYDDDSEIEYWQRSPGIIEEVEIDPDNSSKYFIVTERGILEREYYTLADDGEVLDFVSLTYDLGKQSVFPLTKGKMIGGTQTELDEDGDELGKHLFSLWVDAQSQIQIGACAYDTIPVTLRTVHDYVPTEISLVYLPALDMGIVTLVDEWGSDPYGFTPVQIEVIPK